MAKKAIKKPAVTERMIDASRYDVTKFVGEDGKTKHSRGNGDAVAVALLGTTSDDWDTIAKDNSLEMKDEYPNAGQYRMALGSALRAKVNKGEPVSIGAHTIKKLDQKVALPKAPKAA